MEKGRFINRTFLSKRVWLKSMFREERLDIYSKEKALEYYKQFFEEYKNCKFAGWLIKYVGNLGNPFMAYGTYKGKLEPSRTFISQPGGTIGLLLGQQFKDPNKNVGTAFTVDFDGDGLISGIEMFPPEIVKYEPFIE